MSPRKIVLLSFLAAPLILGAAETAAPASAPAPSPAPAPAKTKADPAEAPAPESTLKQAMLAAEVLKIMGKPASVQPMEEPGGKAEIWVYQRQVKRRVAREPVSSTPIMVEVQEGDGKMHKYQQGDNVQFGDVHYYTEETVQLLMFNDRFVVCKVASREVKQLK